VAAIPPLPPIAAPADIMATARANCAARYHAKDQHDEADAFARGDRDAAWALRHEVNRLVAERGKASLGHMPV
jgi:hypothetical protein